MGNVLLVFIVLVFVATFLFSERILAVLIGPRRIEARRLKQRLRQVEQINQLGIAGSLLRDSGLKNQSRYQRWIDSWPGMATLNRNIRGSGHKITALTVVLVSIALGLVVFLVTSWLVGSALVGLGFGTAFAVLPSLVIYIDYKKRIAKFEAGLVEAIDIMIRALRAGQPFNESMLLVAEELEGPVAEEFGITFAELNYGLAPKDAFDRMIDRVPCVTLKALAIVVLLQRETGGNLAEVLEKINGLLRGRFKFHRKVRTLSAEGRLSAWILTMVPFVLFGMLYLFSPGYVTTLVREPEGHKVITVAAVMMVIGILWIRKIVRIEV